MAKECLQFVHGPTPCFQIDVQSTICSLDFCPVQVMLERNPDADTGELLHSHCVMSAYYGQQNDFEEGRMEYWSTINKIAQQRREENE